MERTFAVRHARTLIGWLILFAVVVLVVLCSLRYLDDRLHVRVETFHVPQKAQLHSIEAAVELFGNESGGYPPSEANDVTGTPYCGAMKLAEATMGQDLLGCHRKSAFWADGLDPNSLAPLYTADTLRARLGPFLASETANVFRLVDIYGEGKTGPFPENALVLCDTYVHKRPSGKKVGMPILYYRADPSGMKHDPNNPDDPKNIYDYRDNLALINLGVPGDPNVIHPLANPKRFYLNTRDHMVSGTPRPYRADFILISAGYDGLYGTADDICNFEWRYRER